PLLRAPPPTLFPYTTLFRSTESVRADGLQHRIVRAPGKLVTVPMGIDLKKFSPSPQGPANLRKALRLGMRDLVVGVVARLVPDKDRKSTRLNSSHVSISYAV